MPFLTKLDAEQIQEGVGEGNALWRLKSDLVYHSNSQDVTITAPAGFVTDFASVPRLPLAFVLLGDLGNQAATIHDYLYSKRPDGTHLLPREQADDILKEALYDTGVSRWRREAIYLGVREFGQKYYDAERADDGSGTRIDSQRPEGSHDD
jgi:hypothetical protein